MNNGSGHERDVETSPSGGNWQKLAIIILLAAVAVFVITRYDVRSFTPLAIKEWILKFGLLAPVVFVTLYTLRPLILFPASIFSLAGGLAFGTLYGGIYNYTGACLSAVLAFFLARYLGRGFVERILRGKFKDFDDKVGEEGFYILFYLRFFAPFDPISYAAGLSKIKFPTFMIATMIPLIPGTFIYANIGNVISKMDSVMDLLSFDFIGSVLLLVLAIMIPVGVKKIANSRRAATTGKPAGE